MTDFHNQMILDQYHENLKAYEIISKLVKEQLETYVVEAGTIVNSVETRIKTEKSLAGKLELKGYKYSSIFDVTDIVGARIVTFYCDEVDKFAARVEKSFDIDWENSIDKRKMHNVDQFGYMSLHYICRIPKTMYSNEKYPQLNDIRFEIQIRSVLQHTWATIHHDTGYKTDVEIPKEYLRKMNQLAGLLELADDLFSSMRITIEDYRRRVKQIVSDGDFSDVELNIDSYNAYIENGGFTELNRRISTINNMEIEEASLRNLLSIFKAFQFSTLKDLDDFVRKYEDVAYEFAVRLFGDTDIDIMTTLTGPLILCEVYVMINDMGVVIIKRLLDTVYGQRKSNLKQAERLVKIGYSMGLIKGEKDDKQD